MLPDPTRKISHSTVYLKIYHERWPNGEYKKIGRNGSVVQRNDYYALYDTSAKVPDDVIFEYFDSNLETQYEVYKNGKRIPYTAGFAEGTRVDIHTGNRPGRYIWQGGKLVFFEEYTAQEKATHENAIRVLKRNDSLRTD